MTEQLDRIEADVSLIKVAVGGMARDHEAVVARVARIEETLYDGATGGLEKSVATFHAAETERQVAAEKEVRRQESLPKPKPCGPLAQLGLTALSSVISGAVLAFVAWLLYMYQIHPVIQKLAESVKP